MNDSDSYFFRVIGASGAANEKSQKEKIMKNGRPFTQDPWKFEQMMMTEMEKKANQHDVLTPEDFLIEKVAGIEIYNPTIDNIEHFVTEYTQNQLYYLGRKLPIFTNLIPNHLNSGNPELVDDASGVVHFNYEGVTVELPFIIYGGELVPFDVIQIGSQRVPYSQEHMKKILKSIMDNKNNPQQNKSLDPYIGVEKTVNPSSTVGFLGNIMSIQDEHVSRGDANHVYASEIIIGDAMEKEAGIFGIGNEVSYDKKSGQAKFSPKFDKWWDGLSTTQQRKYNDELMKRVESKPNTNTKMLVKHHNDVYHEMSKAAGDADVMGMMSKLASMKPYDLGKLKATIEKLAEEQFIAEFEKFASDDTQMQKDMEKTIAKVAATKWENANTQKNGTYIQIPEMKHSPAGTPEITMTPAIVIDSFMGFGFENPKGKVVLTIDQRIKILKPGDNMICLVMDHPTFKIPSVKFESLKRGDFIMAFNGNQAFFPCKIDTVIQRKNGTRNHDEICCSPDDSNQGFNDETLLGMITRCRPIGLNDESTFFNSSSDVPAIEYDDPRHLSVDINLVSLGGGKFSNMSYAEFIDAKAKETGISQDIISSFFSEHSVTSDIRKRGANRENRTAMGVWTVDPNTAVILIKGSISDYLENSKNIEHFANHDEFAIEKMASQSEFVEIRSRNKDQNTFDVKLVYTDRDKRTFSHQIKRFDNSEEYKVRGIMRACGFEQAQAAEAVAKAKATGFARFDLPENATPDNVSGSAPKSVAEDTFKNIKSVLFTPEIKNEMANQLAANILGEVGNGIISLVKGASEAVAFEKKASTVARETGNLRILVCDSLEKRSVSAAACSSLFEKLAMEKQSSEFRDVALAATLASDFMERVMKTVRSDEYFPINKIAEEILDNQSYFEKMAYDLTAFKVAEYVAHDFQVDPNHIQRTVLALSDMIDTAQSIKTAYDNRTSMSKEATISGALAGAGLGSIVGAGFGAVRGHAMGNEGSAFSSDVGKGALAGALGGAVGGGIGSGISAKKIKNTL